ncbi:MAG: hypothetical protein APR62_14080 [Smithella sp. SDB]|nr:MAG: hypothetical protein APR62_14080 [Smithella sp. SDB]
MSDKNTNDINEYSSGKNHRSSRIIFSSKKRFNWERFLLLLLLILILPLSSVAKNLTCNRLPVLMKSLLYNHYAIKNLTGDVKNHAVNNMIQRLDPSKTLLYASDLERFKSYLQDLFVSIQNANCASLYPVYNLLVTRAQENETIVKKILGPDYHLDETLELNIDVKKRPYARTTTEKQILLKKIVQFQIENDLLAGIDLAEAKKKQVHRYELQTMRVVERNPEELITIAAEAFAQSLDPHTTYLSPEDLEDLRIQMQLSLEGIGAVLRSDNGFTIIEELIPGGAAERSGLLKPADKIIAVTQAKETPVNIIDMDLHDVVRMIRGKKGTQVTLTILRQAERTYRLNVTITRDKVDIKEQEAKITYESRKVDGKHYRFGIIDLPSFYGDEKGNKSCYEDVKNLLVEARHQHVDGIVLDLSRNGGGLLSEAVRIAGLFLGEGAIVATKDSHERITIYVNGSGTPEMKGKYKLVKFPAENPRSVYTGHLVVLTSRLSASASEIVAGALKDYNRAVIIGTDHTFGKGSVQVLTPLPQDLGGMKVTTSLFFLPGGHSTQKTGVEADVRLPNFFTLEDIGEAALEYPLPSQTIKPFLDRYINHTQPWTSVEQPMLTTLAVKSRIRIAKDDKFAEIIKNNKEAAERKGIIKLADLRKEVKREGGSKENKTSTELKQRTKEQYAPFVNESINVLLDMVMLSSAQPVAHASGWPDGTLNL